MKLFFKDLKSWGQLVTLIVMIVFFFIIASGIMTAALIFGADITNPQFILLFQAITQLLTFLCPALLFAYFFSEKPSAFFKLDFRKDKWRAALIAIVMLVCLLPLSDWLAQINDNWHWSGIFEPIEHKLRQQSEITEQMMKDLLSMNGIGNLFFNLTVIALVAAVCEEFLFRGVLQQWFSRWIPNHHVAILLTATIFSLAHGEMFSFLPRYVLGIFLGYLFYYSGSILVNISAHFINNATVVIIYYLYMNGIIKEDITENLGAPWYVTIIGTILAIAIFYFTFLRQNSKKDPANSIIQTEEINQIESDNQKQSAL